MSEVDYADAYLFADRRIVRWTSFEHGPERTPAMLERLQRWERFHPRPEGVPHRDSAWWRAPNGRWAFTGELGRVVALLAGRELIATSGDDAGPLPDLPERFLRRPIATMIETAIGPLLGRATGG